MSENDNSRNEFQWDNIGNIEAGRGDLGEDMPVLVYRLFQFTVLDVLTKELGAEKANDVFRDAGFIAGNQFAKNVLDLEVDFNDFLANLQTKLAELKIGILNMENHNADTGEMTLTVAQDLDCSGLPETNETICNYDEGFISGIFFAYTGVKYNVKEIDCWASGAKICRFKATIVK